MDLALNNLQTLICHKTHQTIIIQDRKYSFRIYDMKLEIFLVYLLSNIKNI